MILTRQMSIQSLRSELPAKTVEGRLAFQWIKNTGFLCLPRDRQ